MDNIRWFWEDCLDVIGEIAFGFVRLILFVIAFILGFLPMFLNLFWGITGWPLFVAGIPIFVGLCWFLGQD